MDSPIFGSSKKTHKGFKMNGQDPMINFKQYEQLVALLMVEKNLKKLIGVLNHLAMNKKRDIFSMLKHKDKENSDLRKNMTTDQTALLLQVERRLTGLNNIWKLQIIRVKVIAWRQLVLYSMPKPIVQQRKVNTFHNDIRLDSRANSKKINKKVQQWKENSTNINNGLPLENKKLKNQIQREQMEEESFIAKMKVLLDFYQRPKGGQDKRKR